MTIDPSTHVAGVHLTISDLNRSVRFYESHLGFSLHRRDDRTAWLGAGGSDLLTLSQSKTAPRVRGTTGLYHFAILVPTRADLARALARLVATSTAMQGAADHGVSEALYLADPDDIGIEIYRDRPRAEWPYGGGALKMRTDPLDLDNLLAAGDGSDHEALAPGTTIGHVHLHVSHLEEARRFYVDVLGFDVTQRYGPSALFVSAGGYHHHIGLNTWAGVGAPPPPPGAIGLRHFTVQLPSAAALAEVEARVRAADIPVETAADELSLRDPAGNGVKLEIRN